MKGFLKTSNTRKEKNDLCKKKKKKGQLPEFYRTVTALRWQRFVFVLFLDFF